jgi:hypothetical protein
MPSDPTPRPSWLQRGLFIGSAALAALALRLAWAAPEAALVGLIVFLAVLGARWMSRRRTRQLLRSGDVQTILKRWGGSLEHMPHPETMRPLMTATALAAHGWVTKARDVLRTAERGPAWDAAVEHRTFLDTLLLVLEGQTELALEKAEQLEALPLPTDEPKLIERVRTLRRAMAALARAFDHASQPGDRTLMIEAGDASPLVHWAMRYGAAIEAVDAGALIDARGLLAEAPSWPDESCFARFHREIGAELARRVDPPTQPSTPSPAQVELTEDAPVSPVTDEEHDA